STHIAIPTNIYEQQQVELASLQKIVKKQQSELDFLHEQVLDVQVQLANEMQKCSDISK
ncbi:15828_t:CDS:1, partial [Funneliformis mosseae]